MFKKLINLFRNRTDEKKRIEQENKLKRQITQAVIQDLEDSKQEIIKRIEEALSTHLAIYNKIAKLPRCKYYDEMLEDRARRIAFIAERLQSIKEGRKSSDINITRHLATLAMLRDEPINKETHHG